MAVRGKGLGRGLDSLIPNTVGVNESKNNEGGKEEKKEQEKTSEVLVKITMVEPNREQPRKNFDEDSLIELA